MTYTYADIKNGDLIDSEKVTLVERFAGGDWEFIRVTVASGGCRTESADHPAGATDWRLANVTDEDLLTAPRVWPIEALHGVALEINRRAA